MFTIVALIIAVAAALILLVGVLHVGSSGMESSKVSNAAGELAQMELGLQSLYSGQAAFTGITDTVAIAAGSTIVPANMAVGATSIVNEWNGAVTLAVAAANPANFTITEASVPQDACAVLATKVSNPVSITVNGTTLATPIDVGAVTADCNDPTSNTLVFTFGH